MELRNYTRLPFQLNVALSYPDLGIVSGKVVDLAPEGMFVDTGYVMLPVGAEIVLNFSLPVYEGEYHIDTQAVVIHQQSNGVGLNFDLKIQEHIDALNDFLFCINDLDLPRGNPFVAVS